MDGPDLYAEFTATFPEFAGVPQTAAGFRLDLSARLLSEASLGKWWKYAVFLLTAHYLALRFDLSDQMMEAGVNPGLGSSGAVTEVSASTGGLSQKMAGNALATGGDPLGADLARTSYGLEYLSLLERVVGPGGVVVSRPPFESFGRCS